MIPFPLVLPEEIVTEGWLPRRDEWAERRLADVGNMRATASANGAGQPNRAA